MDAAKFEKKFETALQFLATENFFDANKLLEQLLEKRPRHPGVLVNFGCASVGLGRIDRAVLAWDKAKRLAPNNPSLLLDLGHLHEGINYMEESRDCFRSAMAIEPNAIDPRISLAVLHEKNNQFAEARHFVEECLAIDAKDEQALYFSAFLDHRENKLEEAERKLRDLIVAEPKHPYVVYACRYELAQILDRKGYFDEAMLMLAEAKKRVRTLAEVEDIGAGYDEIARLYNDYAKSLPRDILRTWSKSFPESRRSVIPRLAFLGGHPRSGTTLLEQILGSHPQVKTYDETAAFGQSILCKQRRSGQKLSCQSINILRREYIQFLHRLSAVNPDEKLLIDKNPSPTAFLPLWLKIFPELRVLIALRDPRDVIISCYFQNIPLNVINSNFLSLERIAKHYADLMNVWLVVREWEGFCWLETQYEDIVANLKPEGQRVTKFLGLEWHEDQESFYKNKKGGKVNSPTYHDVTHPIYDRSVNRWRSYEKYLSPVLPVLEPYCRAFGYS